MSYITPKTDWSTNPKNPTPDDFNRIEGNIDFLKADIETKKGLIVQAINEMGQSATLNDLYATLYNKIKAISTDADASVNDVRPGKSFWQGGLKRIGAMLTKAAQTYTPGTTDQIIVANQYLDGAQTIKGDADLIESNIKQGVEIFGKVGTCVPLTTEKKWASGNFNANFQNSVTVSGLAFVPTHIVMYKRYDDGSGTVNLQMAGMYTPGYATGSLYEPVAGQIKYYLTVNGTTFTFRADTGYAIGGSYDTYYWYAFGD